MKYYMYDISTYVAANEIALIAKLIDFLKNIAPHRKRPAAITMMMEKAYNKTY